MDIYEIQELLEDVTFRPFAKAPWSWYAESITDGIKISLEDSFARDSSNFDPFEEIDDWTMLDGKKQTFEMIFSWPESPEKLRKMVAELASYALAHEALEWLWWGDQKAYDPHKNPDVSVRI
jgi:hypothetical protein